MKSIFTFIVVVFYSFSYSQTTYTFHTAGDWEDPINWSPSYPGNLTNGDMTININANCYMNISLYPQTGSVTLNVNAVLNLYEIAGNVNINIHSSGSILGDWNNGSGTSTVAVNYSNTTTNLGLINNIRIISGNLINSGIIQNSDLQAHPNGTNNGTISNANIYLWVSATSFINNQILTGNSTIYNLTGQDPIFINNGIISPGNSPGNIEINLTSSYNGCPNIGQYECEINGIAANTQHDQITVTNCTDLSNTTLNVIWGFTPSIGQEFDIITHGSRTGQFAAVNIPPILGLNFTVDYSDPSKTSIVVSSALPVTWLSSPVTIIKNKLTYISWSVASQVNNSHFIIDQSTDGRAYTEIGKVQGHGNTSETKHYNYNHESPSSGINYYRIKQVDYDGEYSYSDIASVRYDGDSKINIFPNPTPSEVTITTSQPTTIQILDVYGRLLRSHDITEGQNTINLSELPSGILIFAVGNQRYKVLKE